MMRHVVWAAALALLAAACVSRTENADSTALAIDTLKPDTTALGAPDITAVDTVAPTKASSGTTSKNVPTKTASKQGETKELGRDSIIRVDTKDKRRQLPPADTTKRP